MTPVERARRHYVFAVALALILLVAARVAAAQSAEAETLFRDGRTLIKQGQLASGCDKLAASDRLEPMVGTLLNLGDCREQQGKLASAWAAFRRAEAIAKQAGHDGRRQGEAARRAAALEPKLSTIEVDVAERADGMIVRRDDEVVDAAAWGTREPIDPGTYAIRAEAPGRVAWEQHVAVGGGAARAIVAIPPLVHAIPPPPIARIGVAPVSEPAPASEPKLDYVTMRRSRVWSAPRGMAVVLGAAAAGAVGTGIYFGVRSSELQTTANQRCPLTVCADPVGLRDNSLARTDATRANVLYAAAGGGAALALVLWLAGRPGDEVTVRPIVEPFGADRRAGVSLARSF